MKKCVNGIVVEMTPEEIAETERIQRELEKYLANNSPAPSPEERISQLEQRCLEAEAALIELASLAGGTSNV